MRALSWHRIALWAALLSIIVFVLWASALSAQQADDRADPLVAESRALASELGARLRAALAEALANGGPAGAIAVCKDVAPRIAAELARRSGAKIGRTSMRTRNPANAPEPWQAEVLQDFESAGAERSTELEYFARQSGTARYMRAIFAEGVCLVCHGESLAPDVREALGADYPHDAATGYRAGDLRGAFVVVWPQPQ
jgi:Protein of unknown function (DUF3365)